MSKPTDYVIHVRSDNRDCSVFGVHIIERSFETVQIVSNSGLGVVSAHRNAAAKHFDRKPHQMQLISSVVYDNLEGVRSRRSIYAVKEA